MVRISEISIEPCNGQEIKFISDGLNEFNLSQVPPLAPNWTSFDFVAKTKEGVEIGGILGGIGYWNGLEIRALWVHEKYRGKGLGSRILAYIETLARKKGAVIAMLDTFDFQAEKFYLKNGYQPIGEIKDFPTGHRRIYFSKRL